MNRLAWPEAAGELRVRLLQAAPLGASLLVAPGLLASAVDLPKRLCLEALVILGVLGLAAEAAERGELTVRRGALDAPALGLVGWWLVASLAAANVGLALEQTGLLAALAALAWLAGSGLARAERPRLVAALLLAGGIQGIYGILQYAGIDLLPWASSWGSRCFGTIGNPVFYAEFLAPIFVLAAALWAVEGDDERKDLLFILLAILFLALLFAQTRSAWLGSLMGLVVLAWGLARKVPGGRALLLENRTGLIVLPAVAVLLVLTVSSETLFGKNAFPLRDRLSDAVNLKSWTVQHRLVLWRAGALMVRDRPLLGAGPDHFRSGFPLTQATFREELAAQGFTYAPKEPKCHNDYVQHAVETGLVGLGLWCWLLLTVGRAGWMAVAAGGSREAGATAAGLLGGCTALMVDAGFNFPFRIIPALVVFWLFAGLLSAQAGDGPAARRWPRAGSVLPRRRWLAASCAVVSIGWIGWLAVPAIRADRELATGDYYQAAGMWDMAGGSYEVSVALRPDDSLARYQLGLTFDRMSAYDWTGRLWDRSLRQYEEARRLGLNDERLFSQMAMLFEKKGKYRRCLEHGEQALRIFPEYADMLGNVAYWYAVSGSDLARGLELADRALAQVPKHPLYLWDRGLVLEQMHRNGEALADMVAALPRLSLLVNGAGYEADLKKDIARLTKGLSR